MQKFVFEGNWEFDLELNELSDCFSFDWIGDSKRRREKIRFRIIDVKDENPSPEEEQVNTINFILNNQKALIVSIFECLKNRIIPQSKLMIGENEEIFINLDSINDLDEFLGIGNICIFNEWKEGYAYAQIYFNSFRCDLEHGINMIFHKTRFIGTHEDFKEAYEDLGLSYDDIIRDLSLNHKRKMENKEFKFYKRIPASQALKPWQLTENSVYLSRLLHTNQPTEFIEFMKEYKEQVEYNIDTLKNLAKNYGFDDVLKYLEELDLKE